MTYTVKPPQPQAGFNPTRSNFYAYQNFSAERFETTWNHPFWNSQVQPASLLPFPHAPGSFGTRRLTRFMHRVRLFVAFVP